MRRVLIGLGALSLIFPGTERPVRACGDKLLVMGRGVRCQIFKTTQNPASILIYGKSVPSRAPSKTSKLQSVLKSAGHRVKTVEEPGQLQEALHSRQYDLILADLADAAMLEAELRLLPSQPPGLIPLVDRQALEQPPAPEKLYSHVLRTPDKDSRYLATIEQAMKLRARKSLNRTTPKKN